jgi:hypothetical protein
MAKSKKPYKNITIHPAQGGALIGSASDDVPITQESNYLSSSANYTDKVNFRRETDGELRREGWELFNPKDAESAGIWGNLNTFDAIDSKLPIRAIHQFPASDGTPVLIAIAGGKVWRLRSGSDTYAKDYNNPQSLYADDPSLLGNQEYWIKAEDDFYWERIYTFDRHMDVLGADNMPVSPFDGGAYRWEIVDIQNHIVINNGVDLPIIYKGEWAYPEPIYSLRENGIVSVGTIGVFQDRLFCADLTVITDGYETLFTDATDPYGYIYDMPEYGQVKVSRFQYRMVYSAEGEPKLFNSGIAINDSVVMETGGLPGTLTVDSTGRYSFSPDYNFSIGSNASMYQQYASGVFQGPESYTLNMVDPISTIKTVNEDPNSLLISGIFLGEDSTGYKLVDNSGGDLILVNPTTGFELSSGNYTVVLRPYAEQLSAPASFREFSQDGSRILKMAQLADKFVVYRDSGFFFISKTNNSTTPFAIEPRYSGGRVADFRHTIITVNGNEHIFMGNSGIYMINRSSTEPKPVGIFEIGPPFWQIVPPDLSEFVYTVDNPVTREIFINCPLGLLRNAAGDFIDQKGDVIYSETNFDYAGGVGLYADDPNETGDQEYWAINPTSVPEPKIEWGVIAYDYINQTLSTIDSSFTSAAYIRKPKHNRIGPEEAWFVMGVHQANDNDIIYPGTQFRDDYKYGGVLCRYGYGPPKINEREAYRIYNRLGYGYESKLKSGLIDFGDSFSDKECRSYVLELSSKYGTTPVRVKISTATAPQSTEQVETMQTVDGRVLDYVELNNLKDENMIPMYVRAPYMRDEITVMPDIDVGPGVVAELNYIEDQEQFFETTNPTVLNNPIKIVGRTFEVSGVDTRSATQAYNQG